MAFILFLFSPTFEHLKKYLPDDDEKVYSSHSLKWRFGVKPPDVGPASRSELEHGSFDFPGGGVDIPVRRKQLRWKSREIGGGRNKKAKDCKKCIDSLTTNAQNRKIPFYLNVSPTAASTHRWCAESSRPGGEHQWTGHASTGHSLWTGDKRSWGTLKTATWN